MLGLYGKKDIKVDQKYFGFRMEIDKIYNEDCLIGMRDIPDKSIDAIICDLPYGVLNRQNKSAQWDNIIPFEPLWEQYERVIKNNGAIVLFAQGMFTAQLMMSNPKMWRYNLIWDKINRSTGFLNANRCPLRIHEDIVVFYKSQPTYNPQFTFGQVNHKRGGSREWYKQNKSGGVYGPMTNGGKKKEEDMTSQEKDEMGVSGARNRCYGNFAVTETKITNEKYPTSIIRVDKEHDGNYHHPTQKPINLIRWLVRTYTNEGDLVLDNCMGSGTTAIACIKEKRHFIGYEITKEYFDIAQERIKQEQSQLTLF